MSCRHHVMSSTRHHVCSIEVIFFFLQNNQKKIMSCHVGNMSCHRHDIMSTASMSCHHVMAQHLHDITSITVIHSQKCAKRSLVVKVALVLNTS